MCHSANEVSAQAVRTALTCEVTLIELPVVESERHGEGKLLGLIHHINTSCNKIVVVNDCAVQSCATSADSLNTADTIVSAVCTFLLNVEHEF
jgi:hypothetical protein